MGRGELWLEVATRGGSMSEDIRSLSIRMALEWAFMTEFAQLDLDDGRAEFRNGVGYEYVLMQRMKLGGFRIQGGGKSAPHPDADIIAAALTELAVKHRVTGVALKVGEFARTGRVPDWMPGAKPVIEPKEWKRGSRFAKMAKTEIIRQYHQNIVTPHPRNPSRTLTRRVKVEEHYCPCVWRVSLQQIESARLEYLMWVAALRWLRDRLQEDGQLETILITDYLPPSHPWLLPNQAQDFSTATIGNTSA